jgi:YhcH/YjgK/YiaL family protein
MKKHLLFITIILLANSPTINAQSTSGVLNKNNQTTNRKTRHWFQQRKWANGLTLTPHESTNITLFHEQYLSNQEAWDSAFSFLKNQPLSELPTGKYPILGERVFATISEAPAREKDSAIWESHRQYIDIHYVIRGNDQIGITDSTKAEIIKPYTVDATHYTAQGEFYKSESAIFFILFQIDLHKPNIKLYGNEIVKKLVIKVQVAESSIKQKKNQ